MDQVTTKLVGTSKILILFSQREKTSMWGIPLPLAKELNWASQHIEVGSRMSKMESSKLEVMGRQTY